MKPCVTSILFSSPCSLSLSLSLSISLMIDASIANTTPYSRKSILSHKAFSSFSRQKLTLSQDVSSEASTLADTIYTLHASRATVTILDTPTGYKRARDDGTCAGRSNSVAITRWWMRLCISNETILRRRVRAATATTMRRDYFRERLLRTSLIARTLLWRIKHWFSVLEN